MRGQGRKGERASEAPTERREARRRGRLRRGLSTWAAAAAVLGSVDASHAHFGDPDEPRLTPRDPGAGQPGSGRPGAGPPPPDREDEAAPGDPDAPGAIPLFPRLPLARAAGWILPPEPRPDDREGEAEAALERFFDRTLMRDRLEAGDVDGWY
ncbi:MAG TPA: hypothetical protein RMH99_23315, partial [Sandaracinaceae bacterium LLY-WYZ-13_1]|nr:hypothetical protein [Sandaracinaceae bacterium LLY-WYZ-13_1]